MTLAERRALGAVSALFALACLAVQLVARAPAGQRASAYVALHLAMTALMLAAWRLSRRADDRALDAMVAMSLIARVALAPVAPFTTTDPRRYLWDGAVALAGFDPYALPPWAAELAHLRSVFPPPIDHHDVPTCYPPLALGVFALTALAGATWAMPLWKLIVTAASSLTVLIARRATRGTPEARHLALVALSPILALEAGVGAHLDALVAPAMLGSLALARRDRWEASALCAGTVAALKWVPAAVLLPVFLSAPRKFRWLVIALAPLALSHAAAELLGYTPPGSLPWMAQHWNFAAPLWTALYARFSWHDDVIRPCLAAGGLVLLVALSLRRAPLGSRVRDAVGAFLLTSPVLYPWYGVPLAVTTALAPSAWAISLLAVLPVSYEVIDAYARSGVWSPAPWVVDVIAAAALGGLALDLALTLRRRRRA